MIQDLENKRLANEFRDVKAMDQDLVFCFDGACFALQESVDGSLSLPRAWDFQASKLQYLFSIEDDRYFLALDESIPEGYSTKTFREIRTAGNKELAFATATAYHLYQWYRDNRFCGRCGKPLVHSHMERMLRCDHCGNSVYPKIAPAVIVGITNGDKILMTKYSGRDYTRYALVAGFTEIGETAEQTVEREVMEEVGLKVKNIRYYKSQPWGSDSNLLLGFFCDLDGKEKITIDEQELSEAEWFHRDEMNVEDDGISLTREMMMAFKRGEY
ncbi:MAG: NAD(+) diphosphatase [Eubacteriaceae bacterium]|nr:NAD(+) diphosphatase [Eubacteriaceae bacterium]